MEQYDYAMAGEYYEDGMVRATHQGAYAPPLDGDGRVISSPLLPEGGVVCVSGAGGVGASSEHLRVNSCPPAPLDGRKAALGRALGDVGGPLARITRFQAPLSSQASNPHSTLGLFRSLFLLRFFGPIKLLLALKTPPLPFGPKPFTPNPKP
jgi:hypothetical protein